MNKIFCLETEWTQSVHDMKSASQVLPLLEFAKHCEGMIVPYVHRKIATKAEFDYYMQHLSYPAYDNYDLIYLCFHGGKGKIHFAKKPETYSLLEMGEKYKNVLSSRHVHFDSCLTLSADEDEVRTFKKLTGAHLITGFMKSVPFAESFIFELWLIRTMQLHPNLSAKKLVERAEKEVPEYIKKLRFVAY